MSTPTKACLDPWSFLLIKADGHVCLCCWSEPIGNVNTAELDQIVTGLKAQHLRSSLLTGELPGCCRHCPARDETTTERLCEDVETYLNDSDKRYTVSQGRLILSQPVASPPDPSAKKKPAKHWFKRLWKSKALTPLKSRVRRPSVPKANG